jgi:hypothetical protein
MDLSAFDRAIRALDIAISRRDALLDWLTVGLIICNLVVVAGLVVEFHEDAKQFFTGRPRIRRRWGLAFLGGVAVVLGILGELSITFVAHRFETMNRTDSRKIEELLNAKAGSAADAADRATASAKKAEGATSNALALARGARQEADSFEKDIVSAKNQSADAESHLAEALRRAAEARAELNRLKSPRSLTNVPKLISTLAAFKGTEYAFSGVFGDEESINLLQSIDGALQAAGWKRTLPHNTGGIGFFIKFSGWENPSPIQSFLGNGIHIFLDWPEDIPTSLPSDKLPVQLKAAISLNMSIFPHLSPPEEQPHLVQIQMGKSKTVLISVGKKP